MPLRDFDIGGSQPSALSNNRCFSIPATDWHQSLAAAGLKNPEVHSSARYWLQVEGSFTRAVQQKCRHSFHVDVRYQGFSLPTLEEAQRLGIPPRQRAWIREVHLCGDNSPWVLARTIIPLYCLKGEGRRLLHLGNKPLGAYLFSSANWHRGPLETGLCHAWIKGQPEIARRSLFSNGKMALLVGEYFLPVLYR